jgi:hypothetical protein
LRSRCRACHGVQNQKIAELYASSSVQVRIFINLLNFQTALQNVTPPSSLTTKQTVVLEVKPGKKLDRFFQVKNIDIFGKLETGTPHEVRI